MYESYTRQSLADREYRSLLGTSIYVFNSNNSFLIENFLYTDFDDKRLTWYSLTDKTSGGLSEKIRGQISNTDDLNNALDLFDNLTERRNRIIHGFPVTSDNGEQILCTKDKENTQYYIDKKYMEKFIQDNEKLALLLDNIRESRSSE